MGKLRLMLYWIVSAVFLAAVVLITRTWVPDWSYLNHDVALGIAGFWIYWLGTVAIAFSVVAIFLLVYLILLMKEKFEIQEELIIQGKENFWKEYAKLMKKTVSRKKLPHKSKKKNAPAAAKPVEEKEETEVPVAWAEEEFE